MKRVVFLSLMLFLMFGCMSNPSPALDIIPVQFVFSGDSTVIVTQDLFYADNYRSLSIRSHPHINTKLSEDNKRLVLYADNYFSGYTTLTFTFNKSSYEIPVKVILRWNITFQYHSDTDVDQVTVFGNFNFWNRTQLLMRRLDTGNFSLTVPFEPGQYEYLFSVDGKEILDPENPISVPNGLGGYNSFLKVLPSFEGTRPFITPKNHSANSHLILQYHIIPNDYQGEFSHYNIIALVDNHRIKSSQIAISDHILTLRLPRELAKRSSRVRLAWSGKNATSNLAEVILENGIPAGNGGTFKWQDAIIYSLMVDRFYDRDPSNNAPILHAELADRVNFNGGDLYGVIEKLDEGYFNDLGINTIWMLPFIKNTADPYRETPEPHRMFSGYHGYWPIASREVDLHYGNTDDVHTLIEVAHKRDVRILMDFVSNHVHQEHPYYREHPEWFGQYELPDGRQNLRLFDEYRLTTWFESYLPSFDYPSAPEAIDTVISDAIWWLKNYDIDGFRHDAVKHVPNIFWRALTREIRQEFPDKDIFQIGETFGDHSLIRSYVNNGQLSAQFNFNLYWPARYAFAMENASFKSLADEMENVVDIYGQLHLMANLMDSHDQPRYPAYLEHDLDWGDNAQEVGWNKDIRIDDPVTYDKIETYMTYLMTIPGPPVIYYGNEIGMTGAADPDNRRMMRWKTTPRERELRKYIAVMTALRNEHPALRYGDYTTLRADKQIYAYLRSDFNERLLVVIFRKNFAEEIHITLPKELNISSIRCLNYDPAIRLEQNVLYIQTKPYSGYVFTLK